MGLNLDNTHWGGGGGGEILPAPCNFGMHA